MQVAQLVESTGLIATRSGGSSPLSAYSIFAYRDMRWYAAVGHFSNNVLIRITIVVELLSAD